jgi:hypothetical protein
MKSLRQAVESDDVAVVDPLIFPVLRARPSPDPGCIAPDEAQFFTDFVN